MRMKNRQDAGIDNVFFLEKSCRKMYTIFSAVQHQQRKSDVMTSFGLTACSADLPIYYFAASNISKRRSPVWLHCMPATILLLFLQLESARCAYLFHGTCMTCTRRQNFQSVDFAIKKFSLSAALSFESRISHSTLEDNFFNQREHFKFKFTTLKHKNTTADVLYWSFWLVSCID
jgi:hypothetical protein